MIVGLTIALSFTVIAFLVMLDRKDKRWTEALDSLTTSHRLNVIALMERQQREREDHRREVAELCNRLQHPEIVVHTPDPLAAPDEELPLSDEEMAERELYLERIEKLEREGSIS